MFKRYHKLFFLSITPRQPSFPQPAPPVNPRLRGAPPAPPPKHHTTRLNTFAQATVARMSASLTTMNCLPLLPSNSDPLYFW